MWILTLWRDSAQTLCIYLLRSFDGHASRSSKIAFARAHQKAKGLAYLAMGAVDRRRRAVYCAHYYQQSAWLKPKLILRGSSGLQNQGLVLQFAAALAAGGRRARRWPPPFVDFSLVKKIRETDKLFMRIVHKPRNV
ncbi:MAG: hypothetical protein WBE80_06575 [Methylocella sp.]